MKKLIKNGLRDGQCLPPSGTWNHYPKILYDSDYGLFTASGEMRDLQKKLARQEILQEG